MKTNQLFLLTGLAAVALPACVQKDKKEVPEKPMNILYIMCDDHSYQTISAYDHRFIETPNIDRIANEGVRFTNSFVANSLSGPSRACLLTGKHSHKNGFMKNWAKGFDNTQQTLPKILQKNGYQTAIIGKWHLVSKPTGFDYWIVLNDQGEYNNPDFITEEDTVQYKGYVTDIITDITKKWLDSRDKNKPFFLMMHHKAVHRNWVPAEKYYHLYENIKFPLPENYYDDYTGRIAASKQKMNIYRDMYEGHDLKMVTGANSDTLLYDPWPQAFMNRMTPDEKNRFFEAYRKRNNDFYASPKNEKEIAEWKYQRYLQDYLAVVKSVDDSVGEILEYLKENGLDENTLVVYTSDQGFYLGEHGWFDKRFMYEESMVMPMVMSCPSIISPGTKINQLTQNIDFAPTFLDLCGIEIPADMQGISFKPLLEGKKVKNWRKYLYYHYYEFPGFHSVRAHYGIKGKRYKLIHFYKDNNWELYDLKTDPHEMNNIFGKPGTEKITCKLKAELKKLQQTYQVPEELCR